MHKVVFLILIVSQGVFASESKPKSMVDKVHGSLSSSVLRLSNKVDRFFGSKRGDDEVNGTQIRLTYLGTKTEGEDLEHEGLIKFRLKLPYLERLLKVSFKKDPKDKTEDSEPKAPAKAEEKSAVKKIGEAIINEPKKWSFNIQTGVKVEIPPQFFANFRLRRSAFFGKWEFRISQEFFWFSRDGFGETTTIDFDRPVMDDLLFRLRNTATWRDEDDEFETNHGPYLYWRIDQKRAVSFSALAQGKSRPSFHIHNYQGNLSYRQLIYKRWFYIETGPTLDFPKERDWDTVWTYTVKLEALIGSY